jgi:hypothetical protein
LKFGEDLSGILESVPEGWIQLRPFEVVSTTVDWIIYHLTPRRLTHEDGNML